MSQPLSQGGWGSDHDAVVVSPPYHQQQSQYSQSQYPQQSQYSQPQYQQQQHLSRPQGLQQPSHKPVQNPYHNNPYHNNPFHQTQTPPPLNSAFAPGSLPGSPLPGSPLPGTPSPATSSAATFSAGLPPAPRHSPPSHPPPQPPTQQRLARQRPHDLNFHIGNQSPRSVSSPYLSRTPTAPAPPPSPFALSPGNVSAPRFPRPPLSPLGAPISAPASPRFTDFDAFAGTPTHHRPYRPGALSPEQPSPTQKLDDLIASEASYYYSDSSTQSSPENKVRRSEKQALAVAPLELPARTASRGLSSGPHADERKPEKELAGAPTIVKASTLPVNIPPVASTTVEVVPAVVSTTAPTTAPTIPPPTIPTSSFSASVPTSAFSTSVPTSTFSTSMPTSTAVTSTTPTPPKTMAGSRTTPPAKPRNSSMDSAVTALASRSQPAQKGATNAAPLDVAHLIKTAGSAEAAIQYLIKERQSHLQQNAQLWGLVEKQRSMILGLNKDLERALKDKERYRKKFKEVMASSAEAGIKLPRLVTSMGMRPGLSVPNSAIDTDSPINDSMIDSARLSPIDVSSLAPYPITPPADHPSGPLSPVAELLEGRAEMPKPQDHAYDGFDHEAGERGEQAERLRLRNQDDELHMHDIVANFPAAPLSPLPLSPSLAPQSSFPQSSSSSFLQSSSSFPQPSLQSSSSFPPPVPAPQTALPAPPTVSVVEATPKAEAVGQFPSPQTRKQPPAPLDLSKDYNNGSGNNNSLVDNEETRGRRRTREEDDQERQIIAQKEAEARSLSKKSTKKSASQPASPVAKANNNNMSPTGRPAVPESLAGMMLSPERGGGGGPLKSPGLPSSPRPGFGPSSGGQHMPPPLTPRMMSIAQSGPPPSPRPPRQPIPQHPAGMPTPTVPAVPAVTPTATTTPATTTPAATATTTPTIITSTTSTTTPTIITSTSTPTITTTLTTPTIKTPHINLPPLVPPPIITDTALVSSPKSPNPIKIPASPAWPGEAATDEPGVFKGFVTDEHPDLLLTPDTLPAIQVKVASSRMKPSRASLISLTQLEEDPVFTLAVMLRDDPHELWRVEKDSASLLRLDSKMKQCINFTAKTPERSLFSGHAPAKLDARRIALDSYLEQLVTTQLDVYTALELCRYLSTNTLSGVNDDVAKAELGGGLEAASVSTSGRPVRNGYLTKRGKNFGGWKARYFVLDGPQLQYFETPGGPQLGRIKLQNAQIGKQSAQNEPSQTPDELDNQYRHAFLIMEPKKKDSTSHVKHVLCAESDRERDQWVEALLQWTDYKSSDDDEPKTLQEKGRRASAADNDRRAAAARRRGTKSMHIADTDGLIGVSYDSTMTATSTPTQALTSSTPIGHRRRASAGIPENSVGSFPAHDMGDAATWANKMIGMGLAPAATDDKRHKKRSFFGFGPKVRSSSTDGHDIALFDSSPAVVAVASTSSRAAFGATLADAVRYSPPADVNVPLPAVVYRCIQYLDAKRAVYEEGIFRLSGSNIVIRALRDRFNAEGDVNLITDETVYDIHAVASLLKMYLRELPTSILTAALHNQFVEVSKSTDVKDRVEGYAELVQRLPPPNITLLKYLVSFLIKIINHQDANKMSVRNVGIVFSPTLNIPNPVFAALLQHYQTIFGIEPEDYELPIDDLSLTAVASAASMPYVRGHENSPARPATAGGASPSRQRLIEAMERDHHQSHLVINMHPSRGSPSPPASLASVSSRGYEPQYLHEEQFSPVGRRRESTVMGLSGQVSKSRLREETKF